MANRDRIVIGASAGGVRALVTLVKDLPEDLPEQQAALAKEAVDDVLYVLAEVGAGRRAEGGPEGQRQEGIRGRAGREVGRRQVRRREGDQGGGRCGEGTAC